jgi:tRNA threonylcarbamoyladenosine biosynthesis protein TsaE
MRTRLVAPTAEDTREIGAALAAVVRPGDGIALTGELGAGKTTFVQGLARGLGYEGHVASPTFTLVREYRTERITLVHADVYRLDRVQDVVDLGLSEMLEEGVLVVEWGDAVESLLPPDHLVVELTVPGVGDERRLAIRAVGSEWNPRWERLEQLVERWREAA